MRVPPGLPGTIGEKAIWSASFGFQSRYTTLRAGQSASLRGPPPSTLVERISQLERSGGRQT